MKLRLPLLFLLSSFIFPPSSFATDLSISLPLGPYYRAGKYIPVHIAASITEPGNKWLGLAADNVRGAKDISQGAGRTSVNVKDGRVDAIVPWYVLDGRAKRPRLFVEYSPDFTVGPDLHPLGDSERLVGWTTPDESFARRLLHDPPKLVPVMLDPAMPIKGNPVAWEMLDAIILDAPSAARLDQGQIAGLLASGVAIAVKTTQPPFPAWPWKQIGDYAVLQYDPAGPSTIGYHTAAYLPVASWQAGWPWAFRRRVLLIALVCCVLLLGLALWRPPLTALWTILLVAAMCLGIGKWWNLQLAVQQAAGEIVVLNDGLTQTDGWTYQTTSAPRVATLRWSDVSRPIFAGAPDDLWISLNCDTSGRPTEFLTRLPANRKIAFLSRTVGPRAPQTPPVPDATSPLTPMVEEIYMEYGGRVIGQLPGAPGNAPAYGYLEIEQWKALVIDRRKKIQKTTNAPGSFQ